MYLLRFKKGRCLLEAMALFLFFQSAVSSLAADIGDADTVSPSSVIIHHFHTGTPEAGGGCYDRPVYHSHQGSAESGGGCYSVPVYHVHTGSAQKGSGCYGALIYHTHTGTPEAGGGCYGQPVYHTHTGTPEAGGGCYTTPVYHQHGQECYGLRDKEVLVIRQNQGTWNDFQHGEYDWCSQCQTSCETQYYTDVRFQIRSTDGTFADLETAGGYSFCSNCNYTVYRFDHNGSRIEAGGPSPAEGAQSIGTTLPVNCLVCGKTETSVDSFGLGCGKDEKTVDSYGLSCGKTTETVEGYELSCGKSETDADRYELGCGKGTDTVDAWQPGCGFEEGQDLVRLWVEADTDSWTRQLTLRACYEMLGPVETEDGAFVWNEGEAGGEDTFTVDQNGSYSCRLRIKVNSDAKEQPAVIRVSNIDTVAPRLQGVISPEDWTRGSVKLRLTAEDLQADGSAGSGLAAQAYSWDGGRTWSEEAFREVTENGSYPVCVRDAAGNVAGQTLKVERIDRQGPLVKLQVSPSDWQKGSARITVVAQDTGCGLAKEPYVWADTGKSARRIRTVTDPGLYTVTVQDALGNATTASIRLEKKQKPEEGKEPENPKDPGEDKEPENPKDPGEGKEPEDPKDPEEGKGTEASDPDRNPTGPEETKENRNPGGSEEPGENKEPGGQKEPDGEKRPAGPEGTDAGKDPEERREPGNDQGPAGKQKNRTVEKEGIRPAAEEPERSGEEPGRNAADGPVSEIVIWVLAILGALLFLTGLAWLIYLFLRSVRVYNQDGNGKYRYLCMDFLQKREDYWEWEPTPAVYEQAYTVSYRLKVSRLYCLLHREEELVIRTASGKRSVPIDRQMDFSL